MNKTFISLRNNIDGSIILSLLLQITTSYLRCLSIYFLGFLIFQIPSNIILRRWRPSRWIFLIVFLWGRIVYTSHLDQSCNSIIVFRCSSSEYGCSEQFRDTSSSSFPTWYLSMWFFPGFYLLHLVMVLQKGASFPTRLFLVLLCTRRCFRWSHCVCHCPNQIINVCRVATHLHCKFHPFFHSMTNNPIDRSLDRRYSDNHSSFCVLVLFT